MSRHIFLSAVLISLFYVLFFSSNAAAAVFQYFDDEGTLIVTDNPYGLKRQKNAKPMDTYRPQEGQSVALPLLADIQYDYYPVYGRNLREVMHATQASGPYDSSDNKRYAGQTRWRIGWSYSLQSSYRIDNDLIVADLRIGDLQYTEDISVLLPMLGQGNTLSAHDMEGWRHFLAGLVDHEHDHVTIIKDSPARQEALRRVSNIRELSVPAVPGTDPDSLIRNAVEAETARIGHDLIRSIKSRNDEYDRLTGHGAEPSMRSVFFGGR